MHCLFLASRRKADYKSRYGNWSLKIFCYDPYLSFQGNIGNVNHLRGDGVGDMRMEKHAIIS